jgi:predicted GNAT family acetyltransferase
MQKYIHFTDLESAKVIKETGVLFSSSIVEGVYAIAVGGHYVPGVQLTKLGRPKNREVAVIFTTKELPKIAYVEEVIWDSEVINIDVLDIIPANEAIKLLDESIPVLGDDILDIPFRVKSQIYDALKKTIKEILKLPEYSDADESSLRSFIEEYKSVTNNNPFGLPNDRYWYIGEVDGNDCLVKTNIEIWENSILINSIEVSPSKCNGKGFASQIMNEIIEGADDHGVYLSLVPKQIGNKGLNTKDLKSWYSKLGFLPSVDNSNIWQRPPKIKEESKNKSSLSVKNLLGEPDHSSEDERKGSEEDEISVVAGIAGMTGPLGKKKRKNEATIKDIYSLASTNLKSRSSGFPIKLVRVTKNNVYLFDVEGKSDVYRVRLKFHKKRNTRDVKKVNASISCSCPFWRWQGPEHWGKKLGYQYGKTRGTASFPEIMDPDHNHSSCKHALAVMDFITKRSYRMKLNELAMPSKVLPHGVYVTIEDIGDGVLVYFSDAQGFEIDGPIKGVIEAYDPDSETGRCDNALVVRRAFIDSGWGPFLYDILMEYSGNRGITPDKEKLSKDAWRVWRAYHDRRTDVESHKINDCNIGKNIESYKEEYPQGNGPLYSRYTKREKTLINLLSNAGKLWYV